MTRINVGIPPKKLPRQLLIAEHREITRIPNAVKSGKAKIKNIPDKFKLGQGHVKFFYTKLGYLKKRYEELYKECVARNYNVTNKSDAFSSLPEECMGDYTPSDEDRQLIIERIKSKGKFDVE